MKKICDYCGGRGTYSSGVSVVTGEQFWSTCPKCDGKKFIPEDTAPEAPVSSQERRKLGEKLARENIEFKIKSEIASKARQIFPKAFKK